METSHSFQDRESPPRLCRNLWAMAPVSQERALGSLLFHLLPKAALLVLIRMYCTSMSAVETTGTVEGTVEDATHAVVPDVQITLVNMHTGDSRTLTTG